MNMKPTITNAFTRLASPDGGRSNRGRRTLPTLTAAVGDSEFGWTLALRPMRAMDVLPVWTGLGPRASVSTLLLGVDQTNWKQRRRPLSLGAIASRLGVAPLQQFDQHTMVVDDDTLWQLIGPLDTRRMTAIRIEGPIEASDLEAIRRAMVNGRSPLLAELRALAAISVTDDAQVALHTRRFELTMALVAENLRHYLAALLARPVERFSAPPLCQLERLLSLSGRLSVRPIETTVNGSSIDIGVGTGDLSEPTASTRSLIFDVPSNSWHDEP